jgi:dCMP deaminase
MMRIVQKTQVWWDDFYLGMAEYVSGASKDPSMHVGAVITKGKRLISVGFNGFPEGIADTEERLNNREVKYQIVVHGEANAILFAEQSLKNCTLYTYPLAPCSRCAGLVIQKGISRVVYPKMTDLAMIERWKDSLKLTKELFDEADIEQVEVDACR